MTVRKLHRGVRTQFQSVAAQTLDNFLAEELDYYINRAIRKFVNKNRPIIREERSNAQAEEAHDNLRTLIGVHHFDQIDITSLTDVGRGHKMDLSLIPDYEYFIAGRLIGDDYTANCRKMTTDSFLEHAQTTYNKPHFRRPPVTEKDGYLWIVQAADMEQDPEGFMLTYLKTFQPVSSELSVEIEVGSGTGTNDPDILIQNIPYTVAWDTTAAQTVDGFIDGKGQKVYNETGLVVGKSSPDTILLSGYNSHLSKSDIGVDVPTDPSATLNKTVGREPQTLDLPEETHQRIIDMTVMLLKRDLPQASSDKNKESDQQ